MIVAERGRLQEIFTALAQKRLGESLARVEIALAAWRRGDQNVLAAHAEALRHAARSNVLSNRVARAGLDGPETLLRDAFDAGVVTLEEFTSLTGKKPEDVTPAPSLDDEAARAGAPDLPAKRTVLEKLLEDGPVLVHLDPRRAGVDVPAAHRAEARLVLRFGYGLTPPIRDLSVDTDGLAGTLTFRGVPHRCIVPWSAVFAMVGDDGRGLVWSEDLPAEIAHEYTRELKNAADKAGEKDKPAEKDKPSGGGTNGTGGAGSNGKDKPDPEPGKPRRGHLKLV